LTINEGQEVDLAAVADWFFMLFKNYGIRPFKIGYDERYAKVFINRASDYGFELEMLAQGRALSNAMKLTEADLKHRVINYGMNEIDRWCLGNTCCEVDGVGNIQPRKVPGQQARRIDGALTMIMLEEVYRRYGNDFRKICGVA
jgi:phage terminase large subunit-like protein